MVMTNKQFWDYFYGLGKEAEAKFPELLAAQAALESGWGRSLSGVNNYFGIKGSPGTTVTTREVYDGKEVTIEAEFKDFKDELECVQYLVDRWYKDYRGYEGVNRAGSRDEAARLLKEEGYATDPVYPELLIDLMNDNQPETEMTDCFLANAAKYYEELSHQRAAWEFLEAELSPALLELFKTKYRGSSEPVKSDDAVFPLNVPYFWQRDSKTGHGERMCFSSAMAMAMDYIDSDAIEGDDDWYLNEVFKFGDSISSGAQIAAAESLGFTVDFRTDASEQDLLDQLDKGFPVPIGILHHGSIDNPTGGGHWITLIGYDETHFHVHDPFGELALVSGGYPKAGPVDGRDQRYTRKNLMKRWLIANDHDGWACFFR